MMNNRFEKQNEDYMLKCLLAQRQEYSTAKKINTVALVLVIISVVFAILTTLFDNQLLLAISNLTAICIIVANKFIDKYVMCLKKRGAELQQYFDAHFFTFLLDWPRLIWNNIPNQTDVERKIANIKSEDMSEVRNWYSDYSKLDPVHQVFYCQVENIGWDIKLRKKYKWFVLCIVLIVVLFYIAIFLIGDFNIIKIINILALFVPLFEHNIGICYSISRDITRLSKVEEKRRKIEKKLSVGVSNKKEHLAALTIFQNCIMYNRAEATLIPDWFYKLTQKRIQKYEDRVAENITDHAKKG